MKLVILKKVLICHEFEQMEDFSSLKPIRYKSTDLFLLYFVCFLSYSLILTTKSQFFLLKVCEFMIQQITCGIQEL